MANITGETGEFLTPIRMRMVIGWIDNFKFGEQYLIIAKVILTIQIN